ncbi:LLM class F420-dependent oxidoreductase [Nocardioides psychrotolerans]|uniref:Probable F420-dependent oxidoreductase, Rv1855c family n=1 Tax=Nocardioides psychrotolerans TaxID=1005945 RepID=A0A1I3JK22_9ACTN|nr:LLM class F420-dependent oxidoreductase [Nocardioides psychrotolerans]GEP38135.1 LLM class F420-dependent oxidoreductase [Nocardioides psychrotolerans]SFI60348.1 probable F420-dependent oxidoreductase, Rv1855c family [Nocardioides psychrotolerans]
MQLGVHYANFTHPDWAERLEERLTATARVADQGGAAWFTVMDHWFQMEDLGGPAEPMLEGYTTLGYLAAVTDQVRLSLLVTGVTYRHPGLLAKTVTTVDRLSGGRAMLGIGAAWYDREHAGLGVPFPSTSGRFERLEETLQVCRQMWSDDNGAFEGTHYQLAETVCVPPPVQQPGPRILVGGAGERKTLRLVAQYADACNIFGQGPDVMAHKLDVLRRHCDDLGRDYDAIEKSMVLDADPTGDTDAFLADMEAYAALGIELVTLMPQGDDPVAWTTEVCERVLPRLQQL